MKYERSDILVIAWVNFDGFALYTKCCMSDVSQNKNEDEKVAEHFVT